LQWPSVKAAIAIRRREKRDPNISNKLTQLSQITRVRVRHLRKHC